MALIAGLAIFPIVFAAGLDVAAGPTLMFQTLPTAFQAMPAGSLIGLLFFVMVLFAALTSSVALLEAPTVWAIDRFGASRTATAITVGLLAFALGILAALSFNILGTSGRWTGSSCSPAKACSTYSTRLRARSCCRWRR